ncbi:hypothetical protein M1397_00840 [Candidatus Marsarchaeota archaeon]|nr:hypothetical protein [Candidatus Marsarchaeota archaeon]
MAGGKTIGIGIIVIIIVLIGVFVALSSIHPSTPAPAGPTSIVTTSTPATSTLTSTGAVPVMMTDPAQVPSGTSALVFTYTALKVYETGPSGTSVVNATGSGSVNLISIQNKTQVLGYANLSANSTISEVGFNVTSVTITVNGTAYNVPVSSPKVAVSISGNGRVSHGSGVLIDYTPTVSAAFNNNSTTFVRVPAAKAAIVGGINVSFARSVGATASLNANASASLAAITPKINITSASVSASGNNTTISITVKNNGNQSTVINTVNVYGRQSVAATASASAGVNSSLAGSINSALAGGIHGTLNANIRAVAIIGAHLQAYGMQTFSVSSSGTLVLVSGSSSLQSGLTLAPGASATLTYSGTSTYNNGAIRTAPNNGTRYTINVIGSTGAQATAFVTAT